jgi:UDPglucose--hexose-1-phosphate uridylyltransferase
MDRLERTDITQPDGRRVYLYGQFAPVPPSYQAPTLGEGAYQRRWNPLRQEWVLVAAARQSRTFLPARASCPLCPSSSQHSTEIPAIAFQTAVFENRFPGMRSGASPPQVPADSSFRIEPSAGVCEVLVYTPDHEASFATLPAADLERLGGVWTDRYRELSLRPDVKYVFIFENRGEAVGVTLHHPHGQIYAYPFIPPVAALELSPTGECQQCSLIAAELKDGRRLLIDRQEVVAYVPAYARWPYEVHVAVRAHRGALPDLDAAERRSLLHALQRLAGAYDRLFETPMPYMMVFHQRPTDGSPHGQAHLHVEFYPLLRDKGRLKYLAGAESGVSAFVNDTLAEESAARLRTVLV